MGGTKLWKHTSRAAQAALSEEDVVDITHLASLRPLWEVYSDQVQDDASSFLASLVDLAGSQEIVDTVYHVDYHQVQSKRKAFPTHLLYPEGNGPQSLEVLLNLWANTAEGQVFAKEGLRIGQIGRYRQQGLRWTKHRMHLEAPSTFHLPMSYHGGESTTV